MLMIPVLDLRHGQAVRAVAGRRDDYRPLSSPLCPSADPLAVAAAFLRLYPFPVIYIADLDAILHSGDHRAVVAALRARFPAVTFWLDAGFDSVDALTAWPDDPRLRPVIGSESQTTPEATRELLAYAASRRPILSLDFKAGQFLGPPALLAQPELWPSELILMQLDRVGVGAGPALALPVDLSGRQVYAAGGVRHQDDLTALQQAGYAGVLVASALHAGHLDPRKADSGPPGPLS